MRHAPGNTLRPSTAPHRKRPINNQPGLYPTEDWDVFYWDVDTRGHLCCRRALVQLPNGYASVCPVVSRGDPGCIQNVRRWGIQFRCSILEQMGFDPLSYLTGDHQRFRTESTEILFVLTQATHFDLPSHFVIASGEHPVLLFGPDGLLRSSFQLGHTYLGALAYLVTNGDMALPFSRLPLENRSLYDQAVDYLRQALRVQHRDRRLLPKSPAQEME
jgi:hypothetical protein